MHERPLSGSPPVVVVGAGWAGLAAAVELCKAGVPVTLLESARQAGGRARSIRFGDRVVDNGQHLLTGACHSLLRLLEDVGVDTDAALLRMPFGFIQRKGKHQSLVLRAPRLPAPVHLAAALIRTRGLHLNERLRALRLGYYLMKTGPETGPDISVQALLHKLRQHPSTIRRLWEPLCVSALNTPLAESSAHLFANVLRKSFLQRNADSDLLIPRLGLSDLFPQPAIGILEQRGVCVLFGKRVTGIEIRENSVCAVHVDGGSMPACQVILATPHTIAHCILSPHVQLQSICNNLSDLGHEPVTTLYLEYPPGIRLEQPMIALESGTAQWIFDRNVCNQPGLMAAVISARGPHTKWSTQQLTKKVIADISRCYPDWPVPDRTLLVREKRATFTACTGVDRLRPDNRTPVRGLWLAGDYTCRGLPATLEAAVRSGIDCAHALLSELPAKDSVVY